MQTNLEQFREIIRALPLEDFDKLREVLNEEEKSKQSSLRKRAKLGKEIDVADACKNAEGGST